MEVKTCSFVEKENEIQWGATRNISPLTEEDWDEAEKASRIKKRQGRWGQDDTRETQGSILEMNIPEEQPGRRLEPQRFQEKRS